MFKNIILLEMLGTIIAIYSIILSHRMEIMTYPLNIISAIIYIYISYVMGIYTNIIINICYSILNLYGWYIWIYNKKYYNNIKITYCNNIDFIKSILFTLLIELLIIITFFKSNNIILDINFFLDIITSFLFFIAMYQMIIKKVETWIFWTIGNLISIILYLYNGMIITSIQYLIYTFLSIKGFFIWKNEIINN